jgi:predicted phosphodiesterase
MVAYRLAVFADIHGNLPAFEAVMVDLKEYGPVDAILVAGDVVGGPGQQTILRQLMECGAVMIQGNGEERAVRLLRGNAPDHYYKALQFSLPRWINAHLSVDQRDFLQKLPEQRGFSLPDSDPIRIVHGSPHKVDELVLPDRACHPNLYYEPVLLAEVIGLVSEPVIIFGHTHLPWQTRMQGKLALNPGAVNFPENDFIGAQYALLDWDGVQWIATFHQVPYDLERLKRDYQESGLLSVSPLARAMLQSVLSGTDYLPVFFRHVRQVANEFGTVNLPYYPDEIWERAERTFPWLGINMP